MFVRIALVLLVLCAATAPSVAATSATPQQRCDMERLKAWGAYVACLDVVANNASAPKCRHVYFSKWDKFQTKASLSGSTCVGNRFTDNGDGTVTDNLTRLQWEKKTTDGSIHDVNNGGLWSTSGTAADGDIFQSFLPGLNAPTCFAGQCDWRLPTVAELQTLLLDFPCTKTSCACGSDPCIDNTFGPEQTGPNSFVGYWSDTNGTFSDSTAWVVIFSGGSLHLQPGLSGRQKTWPGAYVRAVRGGQ